MGEIEPSNCFLFEIRQPMCSWLDSNPGLHTRKSIHPMPYPLHHRDHGTLSASLHLHILITWHSVFCTSFKCHLPDLIWWCNGTARDPQARGCWFKPDCGLTCCVLIRVFFLVV